MSVIFHEPMILLIALAALSVKIQDNRYARESPSKKLKDLWDKSTKNQSLKELILKKENESV